MDVKRCSKCGETKPVEMFSQNRRLLYCNVCESQSNLPMSKGLAKAQARFEAAQQVKDSRMKQCRKCGETKPVEMFSGNGREKDGFHTRCIACISEKYQLKDRVHYSQNNGTTRQKKQPETEINTRLQHEIRQQIDETKHENVHPEIEIFRTPEQLAKEAEIRRIGREEYRGKLLQYTDLKPAEMWAAKRADRVARRAANEAARQIWQLEVEARRAAEQAVREANRHDRELQAEARRAARKEARLALERECEALRDVKRISKSSTLDEIRAYRRALYLLRQIRIKANGGTHTRAEIRALLEAQNHQCAYCKRLVKLTKDHIIPLLQGGRHDIANICMACRRCNVQKNARTPEQWVKRWYLEPPVTKRRVKKDHFV